MEKLYADITGEAGDIDRYAASTALSSARSDAKSVHDRHLVHTGDVSVLNTTATAADLQRKIPNVQLTSCLDISRWKVMNTKTGKPAALPSGRLTKFVAVSTVERWPKGWRVIRNEPQGKPC
ncbi:secreted protein/lipoprotein [Streptomyces formicae]|uniref:Secreted protein/lipoprotein n=1 Tax=Streptomyces formicae TaxID=1616117 RepID=A0ABY3WKM9_9ACTN|nr:secreted protein/lipoprotein [Streptomyces formicae]UNM13159.1 secreted protein/lipoprotein [Streptomyces formicae]